jgi:hypothetical protein
MKVVAATKVKGLRIATRCQSLDEFITAFHRNVDEESFFIATRDTRPIGLETAFAIELADGTPALRGRCSVLQVWKDGSNPFKHPGLLLGIKRLTASSLTVFEQLLVRRDPPAPPPVEARTPGSELVLPANPLGEVTDAAIAGYVDCTLYEETGNYFVAGATEPSGALDLDDVTATAPVEIVRQPSIEVDPSLSIEAMTPPPDARTPPPFDFQPPPPPEIQAEISPPVVEAAPLARSVPSRPRWHRPAMFAAGAVGVIATSMIVLSASSHHGTTAPPPAPQVASTAPVAITITAPPPPAAEPATAGCTLAVEAKPADSVVELDGQPVSGGSIATTCTRHRVDVGHARYQNKTEWVTLAADHPGSLDVQLARPTHQVVVTSTPPSATIFVNGLRVGIAPVLASVPGFEPVTVRAEKAGFRTVSQKLYSKSPHDQLAMRLAK